MPLHRFTETGLPFTPSLPPPFCIGVEDVTNVDLSTFSHVSNYELSIKWIATFSVADSRQYESAREHAEFGLVRCMYRATVDVLNEILAASYGHDFEKVHDLATKHINEILG
tara:strand:- start:17505 stop:17840 length:336 start_codon:yes stop_codon:yes gene_type:complete